METEQKIYRRLQRHLHTHPVGFPKTHSGADLRFLQRMFTPEEARLALYLSYKPAATTSIAQKAAKEFSGGQTASLLENMFKKGSIGWTKKDETDCYYIVSLVLGMYEYQGGNPSPGFVADTNAYTKTPAYGLNFLSVSPAQMRTIPVHKNLSIEHPVMPYCDVRRIIEKAKGPFVIIPCVCRQAKVIEKKTCRKTKRLETCLGFDNMGAMMLRRGHGREISREEALEILTKNEEEGLVLQPTNTSNPEFVCSCCGCCCGMLGFQKLLPRPVDFWSSNYFAEINASLCISCGKCVQRCQVGAVTIPKQKQPAVINLNRCIGCGLCTACCPAKALRLRKKEPEIALPNDTEEMLNAISANRKGVLGKVFMILKMVTGKTRN